MKTLFCITMLGIALAACSKRALNDNSYEVVQKRIAYCESKNATLKQGDFEQCCVRDDGVYWTVPMEVDK